MMVSVLDDIGQSGEWRGRVGDAWAREWRRTDRSFAELTARLMTAILDRAPDRGTAVDLGCGAGETAIALAGARPDLTVTGVDISDELVAVAKARATSVANLSFQTGDTARLDPPLGADLMISRHGVMFFDDPVAAFAAIRRASRHGASLVFSCFADRARNDWARVLDAVTGQPPPPAGYAPGPFGFADRDWTGKMLADAGWRDSVATPVDFTYVAGAGDNPVDDARSFFSRIGPVARVLADAPADRRATLLDQLGRTLADHQDANQVAFPAAAWIWTATNGDPA